MDVQFIISQMVNFLHIPICIYSKAVHMLDRNGQASGGQSLSAKEEKLLLDYFLFEEVDGPMLNKLEDNILYLTIKYSENEWILYGPVMIAPSTADKMNAARKRYKALEGLGFEIQSSDMEDYISGVLLLYYLVSGKKFSTVQFWEINQDKFPSLSQMSSRLSDNLFERQEGQSLHNPYSQELRELESIKNGDIDALNKSISETYEGKIGILAKDPLRHHKNVAIGNITMASRAAVSGGVNVELAFSMADSFIQQIEEIDNISEVEIFKRAAQRAYATAVKENKRVGDKVKNPLVEEVKNYIFSHLHDNIRIEDIAKALHVSSDYLSHVFSSSEKVTIKRYILQEKIIRSKNLLCYSNYSLQEIAFYLGFSTQSYFTKIFKDIVGITPGEYRSLYKKRENF